MVTFNPISNVWWEWDRLETVVGRHTSFTYLLSYLLDLLARVVIAVQKWSLQVQQNEETTFNKFLWRNGLLITYEDGYFLVEAFHDEEVRRFFCFVFLIIIIVSLLNHSFSSNSSCLQGVGATKESQSRCGRWNKISLSWHLLSTILICLSLNGIQVTMAALFSLLSFITVINLFFLF